MAVIDPNAVASDATPDWVRQLGTLQASAPPPAPAAAAPANDRNFVSSGLATGMHQLVGSLGSTGEALGALTGWQGLQDYGHSVAANREKLAAASGRPDLEHGGENSSWLNPTKLGYEITKAIPSMGGMLAAGTAAAATAPAWLPEGAAALAASAPLWLRGAATGEKFAAHLIGGAVGAYPLAVGANVEQAKAANGGELTRGAAGAALAAGVPEAALAGATPAALRDMDFAAIGGPGPVGLAKRLLARAGAGATINAPQAALQTAVSQQFGPEKSMTERAKEIVDSAIGGGVIGGAAGAAFHAFARKAPKDVDLDAATDIPGVTTADPTVQPEPARAAPAAHPLDEMPADKLREQYADLTGKDELSQEEQAQLALTHEAITRRTMPGREPGEGEWFTPEQVADRAEAAQDFTEKFAKDNPGIPKDSPLVAGLVTSEPEAVNVIEQLLNQKAEAGNIPQYLLDLAQKYEVADATGAPVDLPAKVAAQDGKVAQLKEEGAAPEDIRSAEDELARLKDRQEIRTKAADMVGGDEPAEIPADQKVPEAPPKPDLPPDALERWDNMSLLAKELADDPEAAAKAQQLADSIVGSKGAKYLKAADRFAKQHADDLATARQKEAMGPTSNDNVPPTNTANDNVSGAAPANDNPRPPLTRGEEPGTFADGSQFSFMNDNTPGAPKPQAPVTITQPATHVADIQAAQRTEAQRLLEDPTTTDAEKGKLQKALDLEATGLTRHNAAVMKAVTAIDAAREKKVPNGPFDSGEGQVVGTATVPHEHVSFVQDALNAAGMGNLRIMLAHPDDVIGGLGDAHGLNGSYGAARMLPETLALNPDANGMVRQFGPDGKDFMVYVKPGLSDALTASTLAEEVGHVAKKVLFNQAPDSTKAAVQKAFQNDLKKANPDMKAIDLLRLMRNKAQADEAARTLDPNMKAADLPNLDYYRSFDEWFANHVSRWFTAADKDTAPRTAIDRFFKSVAQVYRNVVKAITGDGFLPDAAVKRFMDQASNSDAARLWAGDPDGTARFSKAPGPQGPQTVPEMTESVKKITTNADSMIERASSLLENAKLNILPKIRNSVGGLWWVPDETLERVATSIGLKSWGDLSQLRENRGALVDKIHQVLARSTEALYAGDKQEQADLQRVMRLNSLYGVDPARAPEKQPWLTGTPNEAERVAAATEANAIYNRLAQRNGGIGRTRYEDAVAANKVQLLMKAGADQVRKIQLYNRLASEPIADTVLDAHEQFQMDPAMHDDVKMTRDHFWAALQKNNDAINARIAEITTRAAAADAENVPAGKKVEPTDAGNAIRREADDLRLSAKTTANVVAQLQRPYFHLGRDGDHFVGAKLALEEDGQPNAEAVDWIQKELDEQGFSNVSMVPSGDNGTFFARVDTPAQMARLGKIMLEAQKLGHVDADEAVHYGYPEQLKSMLKLAPQAVQDYIERLQKTELPDPSEFANEDARKAYLGAKDKLIGDAIRTWLDMYGQNSLNKVSVERNAVHGFDPNMFQNFARRNVMTAHGVANQVYGARLGEIRQNMADEVAGAKTIQPGQTDVDWDHATRVQDFANEALAREAQAPWNKTPDGWATLRRWTHAVVIGMSPAYVSVVLTQIPTLVIPTLGKTFGFAQATRAVAENASLAMKMTMTSLAKNKHFGMSQQDLQAAGYPQWAIDTVLQQDNSGKITSSGWTRQNNDYAAGGTPQQERARNYSNLLGYGVETYVRILAGLAAHKLYDSAPEKGRGMSRADYVGWAIDDSNFKWGQGSNARAATTNGFAGPISPLMFNFMGFQTRMIGKLYTEMRAVLGKEGPEAQKEAGRFLAGHLAATVAIAGTIGMPGSGWFAGAADRVGTELTGRDDFDVKAMYRSWLADTFGQTAGRVLAHGLPYGAGLDLTHSGGERLLPFTDLIANKRNLEDAEKDWTRSMQGSGLGMALSAAAGARAMLNGEYMEGLSRIIPGALHGPLNAARLATYGYEDNRGVKIPLDAGAKDILLTALGMKPAEKAEYDEKMKAYQGVEAERHYHNTLITKHLDLAFGHNDMSWLTDALGRGIEGTENNPGIQSPLQSFGADLMAAQKKPAIAGALGMPSGVAPNDLTARELLRY